MHIWIFDAFFSSLAHSSVFLTLFRILRRFLEFVPSIRPSFLSQYFALLACGAKGLGNSDVRYRRSTEQEGSVRSGHFTEGISHFVVITETMWCKTAAWQLWKTTVLNAGLGVGQCLTDAHQCACDKFWGPDDASAGPQQPLASYCICSNFLSKQCSEIQRHLEVKCAAEPHLTNNWKWQRIFGTTDVWLEN